jgi:hypothetical protein
MHVVGAAHLAVGKSREFAENLCKFPKVTSAHELQSGCREAVFLGNQCGHFFEFSFVVIFAVTDIGTVRFIVQREETPALSLLSPHARI